MSEGDPGQVAGLGDSVILLPAPSNARCSPTVSFKIPSIRKSRASLRWASCLRLAGCMDLIIIVTS